MTLNTSKKKKLVQENRVGMFFVKFLVDIFCTY